MEPEPSAELDANDAPPSSSLRPSFPPGRVKRIIKLDRDIKKLNGESLHVINLASELFLGRLTQGAAGVARGKKRKTVRPEHVRAAVQAHRPTRDFLLDCLPEEEPVPRQQPREKQEKADAATVSLPPGARRIDHFFHKAAAAVEAE